MNKVKLEVNEINKELDTAVSFCELGVGDLIPREELRIFSSTNGVKVILSLDAFVAGVGWVKAERGIMELDDNLGPFPNLIWFIPIGSIGLLIDDGILAIEGLSTKEGVINFCGALEGIWCDNFGEWEPWEGGERIFEWESEGEEVGVEGWAPAP